MSSGLQLDVRHHIQWRRHLVNAYEVQAGMVFFCSLKAVLSMPERFKMVYRVRRYKSALLYIYLFIIIIVLL